MKTGRRDETQKRPHWAPIALIAIAAVVVRLIIAYGALLPESGFATDLQSFRYWAAELGANGAWGFYNRGFFVDYLPGYLTILWLLGGAAGMITGNTDPGALVKLPAILADGLLVVATARLAFDLGASRRAQMIAAGAVALLPATWIDSTVWGQVDAVGTCVLLLAASELVRGNTLRASGLTAFAALLKPQFGVVIPIVATVALVRAARARDPWRFAVAGLAGAAVITLVAAPFGFTILDVLNRVLIAGGGYAYLTVGAWNPWALVSVDGAGLVENGGWARDIVALPGIGLPGVVIGATALLGAIIFAAWRSRRDERATTIATITLIAIAFFVLPTRVHERYLFAAIPLATALAASRRNWIPVAVVVNLLFTANVWSALTAEYLHNQGIPDLGAFTTSLHNSTTVALGAVLSAVLLLLAIAATLRTREEGDNRTPGVGATRRAAGALRRASKQIPYLVSDTPAAPRSGKRSAAPTKRRIDRVDLWMLLVIAVSALALRGWRVGDPPRFHFDEIYHVRTATEFLQDWRYDEPHAIYEYTHPHLAKYAIAAGIELFGAPRVDARSDYGDTIAAVASRSTDAAGEGRIWIATPGGIDVINPATRGRIGTIAIPDAVVLAPDATGGLWGVTESGGVFRADPAVAATGARMPLITPHLVPGAVAAAPTSDGALIVATSAELVRIEGMAIVARTSSKDPHDLFVVMAGDNERVVVSGAAGITLLDANLSSEPALLSVPGGAGDLVAVDWSGETQIYAATAERIIVATVRAAGAPTRSASITVPGATALIAAPATRMIHAVAPGPDGTGRSLWSIEPNGNARFADTPLGAGAGDLGDAGIALDASAGLPDGGRGELIVASGDGTMVQVAIGDLPAGWRWPGVIAGAVAAALLALLARLLTERRDIAALAGLLALLDGAGFVQSRIGMNDVYLLVFLLGAFVTFIAWVQGRSTRAFGAATLLTLSGVLLGAALASKWVALYGIAGLGLVWLGRSALGRIVATGSLVALFALLLPQALAAGDGAARSPNIPFAIVAVAVVAAAAAIAQRASGVRNAVRSLPLALATLSAEAAALAAALVVIPLGIYLLSYLPWIALGNHYVAGAAGTASDGQTLVDLTAAMYRYHDTLRVAHAASSPWWAWPFDLKPVWFFQSTYDGMSGSWSGAIYDGGNVLSRLLGIAGLLWATLLAWRERSAAHATIVVLYLAMWLPWARIDRAAFQYHYYPAAQLSLVALAMLLADVRQGRDRAAILLRRAAAAAVLFAPIAWVLTGALCAAAGVASVYQQSQVCLSAGFATPGPIIGAIALIPATLAAWAILGAHNTQRTFRGALLAIAIVALLWYPNWSALPLPTGAHNWYQGLLPTWVWAFQFGVTLATPTAVPLVGAATIIEAVVLLAVALLTFVVVSRIERRRIVELDEDRT